jgi:hypothetical protein
MIVVSGIEIPGTHARIRTEFLPNNTNTEKQNQTMNN